jgi:AraC family transcriptional regulator, ethanolamine operon transcriptional activator
VSIASAPTPASPVSERAVCVATVGDVDELAVLLANWDTRYQQLSPGLFTGHMSQASFGGLQLFRESTTQQVHQSGMSWPNSLTFGMPLALSEPIRWRGGSLGVDDIACYNGDDELDIVSPLTYDFLAVAVDIDDFTAFAERVDSCDPERWQNKASLARTTPERQSKLKSLLSTVLSSLEATEPTIALHPQVQKSLRETIYANLIEALGADEISCDRKIYGQRSALVAKARQHLYDHPDVPTSVADLCSLLSVSRRNLQYAFQEVMGINPVAYLRALRLNAVRREIKVTGSSTPILDIAANWGFWHPSHFCADYRRMFGETPSDTRRRYTSTDASNLRL